MCMTFLTEVWPDLGEHAQNTILSEIAIAVARGDLGNWSLSDEWNAFGEKRYRWLDANRQAVVQRNVKPLVKKFPWSEVPHENPQEPMEENNPA